MRVLDLAYNTRLIYDTVRRYVRGFDDQAVLEHNDGVCAL